MNFVHSKSKCRVRRGSSTRQDLKNEVFLPFQSYDFIPETKQAAGHKRDVQSKGERFERVHSLRNATGGFDCSLMVGEGGYAKVYKGTIAGPPDDNGNPAAVAIKKLNEHGYQVHKQWFAEVQFLSVVNHPNLVKLLGYCSAGGERGRQHLLVYEYMPNKNLQEHLFNSVSAILPWKTRLEIILGAARELAYLHEGLEIKIIYRDFKSSNVLLDEDFRPKLSGFGLAREGQVGDHSYVITEVLGTYGYAAPEYVEPAIYLSIKTDVYSFGVVLYELLTGRRVIDTNLPPTKQKLLEWVEIYPANTDLFTKIIDPRLGNKYSVTAARKIANLADSCLKDARKRPKISRVVQSSEEALEGSEEGNSS